MGTMEIKDNAVWIKHIRNDEELAARLDNLTQNQIVMLEVAGIAGEWAKMRDGRDGRKTPGIRPEGKMVEVWKDMQARRGETIEIRALVSADEYVESLQASLNEWTSSADEEAYSDL